MPSMFGKDSKKKELIKHLGDIYATIEREQGISRGDFPELKRMQEQLLQQDFTKFHQLRPKLIETVDQMLAQDIARLMEMIPLEEQQNSSGENGAPDKGNVEGGAFEAYKESPFGFGRGEGADAGKGEHEWIVNQKRDQYDEVFDKLNPVNGKVSGAAAKAEMVKSKLPNSVLGKIWKLSDIDRDGMLDIDEWALANHLISIKMDGHDLPNELPQHLVPPSKKNGFAD